MHQVIDRATGVTGEVLREVSPDMLVVRWADNSVDVVPGLSVVDAGSSWRCTPDGAEAVSAQEAVTDAILGHTLYFSPSANRLVVSSTADPNSYIDDMPDLQEVSVRDFFDGSLVREFWQKLQDTKLFTVAERLTLLPVELCQKSRDFLVSSGVPAQEVDSYCQQELQ